MQNRRIMPAQPVLLIDRDAEWCVSVSRFLEPRGIAVVATPSVEDAAEHLRRGLAPTVVLMDIESRPANQAALATLRPGSLGGEVPVGYMRKSAALDALLLMLPTSAPITQPHAA